jgi:signal transduction histidine kinase
MPMRVLARWLLALLPLALGAGFWAAARLGDLPDQRLRVSMSALRGDWLLAAGFILSLMTCAGLAIAAGRDRHWRRRVDAQAAAYAHDRRLLLSRLDHELKNPLTAMLAATANVSATMPGADPHALRSIGEQVLRLSRLTADLRKIADVEGGTLDRRPVDMTTLLEEAVDVAREQPGAGKLELRLDLPRAPWPLPHVLGDEELLSLVVGNLLDNAVKYTPEHGTVAIETTRAAEAAVVSVRDTGIGISAEDLAGIFERFYRSDKVRSRGVGGFGLGLPIARGIAHAHEGTIEVTSAPGAGTTFRVCLPILSE